MKAQLRKITLYYFSVWDEALGSFFFLFLKERLLDLAQLIWIESDSALVVLTFNKISMIPCRVRNRWLNYRKLFYGMNFVVTHIYREGNRCADKLSSTGLELQGATVWTIMHDFLKNFLVHDRLGLPNFRVPNV